jgi:RNA polymerase sigma-70 factor (ECF subfamily)
MNRQIVDALPHLQRYAWHLTRRRDEADDLVQDCVERTMLKSALFAQGTNLRAWMFTMMRNIFINGKRRQGVADRHVASLKHDGPSAQQPTQFHAAVLRRTHAAIDRLSSEEREAVMLLAVQQRSYGEVTTENGSPIGTMKSRLSRARAKLRKAVLEDVQPT